MTGRRLRGVSILLVWAGCCSVGICQQKAATDRDVLAADTAKLVVLANELKVEMDKTTKDTLSLSVMRKADEVERLARKVRMEMKASLGN